jgi:putative membrane protein
MDLLIATLVLRPYVFAFVALFLVAGALDLGWRRTLLFAAWVWPVAWLAEFSSTRTGFPFGLYHYTGTTRGVEMYLADVPLMDSLSFTFLAYASFCLARLGLSGRDRPTSTPALALLTGVLMMLLDVVVDPLAVRGDRWFLGRIFYYPAGGAYFGVPLSNFVGWMIVGAIGAGGFLYLSGIRAVGEAGAPAVRDGASGRIGRRWWPGVALYYAVLAFNLAVTGWIGEWVLLAIGVTLHASLALLLWCVRRWPGVALGLESQSA